MFPRNKICAHLANVEKILVLYEVLFFMPSQASKDKLDQHRLRNFSDIMYVANGSTSCHSSSMRQARHFDMASFFPVVTHLIAVGSVGSVQVLAFDVTPKTCLCASKCKHGLGCCEASTIPSNSLFPLSRPTCFFPKYSILRNALLTVAIESREVQKQDKVYR